MPSASCFSRNSSSCEACAEVRNRTDAGIAAAGRVHRLAHAHERVLPGVACCTPSLVSTVGLRRRVLALDPGVLEAADVAHPELVDLGVIARRHANQPRALCPLGLGLDPGGGVAALRAQRADRVDGVRVVPGPRAEAILPRRDRADRADVHQVAGQERVHALLVEGGDLAAVAAIDDADLRVAVDLAHEADAPRAQDAAVAVEHQRRAEIHVGAHALAVEHAPREVHAALGVAET